MSSLYVTIDERVTSNCRDGFFVASIDTRSHRHHHNFECRGTTMKLFATVAMIALISAAVPASAAASTITLDETFSISGFSSGAPLSTLTGSFSLSFDNSADALDTTGTVLTISVAGLSLAGATPMFAYDHATDTLHLGAYSVGNFNTSAGTDYIDLQISNVSTIPVFVDAQYSQVGETASFVSRTGTLAPIQTAPEPSSLALFGLSALAAGARKVRRRRQDHQTQ